MPRIVDHAARRREIAAALWRVVRDQGTLLMLGTLRADERIAVFLLGLLRRTQRLSEPEPELTLSMRREEIASYLGMTLETVSRALGRLQRDGLLEVHLRQVIVRDIVRLQRLGEGQARA